MSVSRFPNPRTTNFIPEAWDFTILNRFANFILTYPIAQNASIVFQKVSVGTATLLTQMANTIYVNTQVQALLTALNTWTGLNTFGTIDTGTITTNTITATTLALSGTQLDTPMTSTRTYPVVPFTSSTGTVAYGTAGTIGYTLVNSDTYGDYFGGGGSTRTETKQSLSIPTGVWYLVGEVICNSTFGQLNGLSFGLTAPAQPIVARPADFFGGDYMILFSTGPQNNTTLPFGGAGMTISAVFKNTTLSPITVRLFLFRPGYGWTGGGKRGYLTATKIA